MIGLEFRVPPRQRFACVPFCLFGSAANIDGSIRDRIADDEMSVHVERGDVYVGKWCQTYAGRVFFTFHVPALQVLLKCNLSKD